MVSLEFTRDIKRLEQLRPAWETLSVAALEANLFYESWMLLPALRFLADTSVGILLIWQTNKANNRVLIGLCPLQFCTAKRAFKLSYWSNWLHEQATTGVPLVHVRHAESALQALMNFIYTGPHTAHFLLLRSLPQRGAFRQTLERCATRQARTVLHWDQWARACLAGGEPAEAYIKETLRTKKYKEYRRLLRRLQEQGTWASQVLSPCDTEPGVVDETQAQQRIQQFLALEQSGWKGSQGSALGSTPQSRAFAHSILTAAFQRQRLMLLSFTLDQCPVAIKVNLLGQQQRAYAFKIAYHEAYARFSPGVLLELENIRQVLDHSTIQWMDSCAIPDHPMINHLWRERLEMADMMVSAETVFSRCVVSLLRQALPLLRRRRQHFIRKTAMQGWKNDSIN